MFGVSGGELLVAALAALLILGPRRLPEAARTAGRLYGRLHRLLAEARGALKAEMDELARPPSDSPNPFPPAAEAAGAPDKERDRTWRPDL